jgi:glycosyltransferase involved in cell wall biosynthesis
VAAGVRAVTPRVLHAPVEIAGQVALSAHGLRLAGLEATAYCEPHAFDFGVGPDVVPATGHPLRYLRETAALVRRHDIVHYHFARSFLADQRRFADARAIARLGRRVLMTFHGSEVRRPSIERARNPHYVPFAGEDDRVAEDRLRRWAAITGGHAVVLDPALVDHVRDHFPRVDVLRLMVDTERYRPAPPDPAVSRPRIVHSPTERAGKGTEHVRAAVAALRERGLEFDYDEVFGETQAVALERYARADLVIDQLCVGSHGVFAIEAMSLAKPVICHVAPARDRFPDDLPIIQADPTTIAGVLADWIGRPQDRHELGRRSRAYAEREHDVRVVGRRLAQVYGA